MCIGLGVSVLAGLDHWTGLVDCHNFMQKSNYDIIIDSPPSCFVKRVVCTDRFTSVQMETFQVNHRDCWTASCLLTAIRGS